MFRGFLLTLAFCAAGIFASANTLSGINLVNTPTSWEPACDEFGSSLDTGSGLFQKGIATVSFTLAKMKKEGDYPYVELVCRPSGTLSCIDSVTVTYRCDKPLIVKFAQPDFISAPTGDDSYAFYQYIAPVSSKTFSTITIPLAKLTQPEWTPAESKGKAFNRDVVNALYFTPAMDDTKGGKARLEVQSVILK